MMTVQTMEDTAAKRAQLLDQARECARRTADNKGSVTADDIDESVRVALGPAAGSIFKGGDFVFTGKRVTSTLPSNHSRELKVWKLTEKGRRRVTAASASPQTLATRQTENRLSRPPVTPEITEVTHAPLPSWLQ